MLLALSSYDSFLVFRKTGRVAMGGEELVDIVVVRLHGTTSAMLTSIDFYHLGGVRAHAFQRGDIIH